MKCRPPRSTARHPRESALLAVRRRALHVAGALGFRADDLDADDAGQEAVLAVLAAEHKFDPERAPYPVFARVVADSALRMRRRALYGGHRQGHLKRDPLVDPIEVTADETSVDLRIDVWRTLPTLTPDQRELCRLVVQLGVSDTARRLGVRRGTVYDRLARIRATFEQSGLDTYLDP